MAMVAAEFGWMTANSVMVMNAASSGARFFAGQRGTTTPYTDTNVQIKASAAYLTVSGLSYSTSVANTSCSTNDNCATDLSNAVKGGAITNATVTVNYVYKPLTGLAGWTGLVPESLSATAVARVL